MRPVARHAFRISVILGFTLEILATWAEMEGFFLFNQPDLKKAQLLNYYGALFPFEVVDLIWWLQTGFWIVSCIGFVAFRSWSRFLLAGTILGTIFTSAFLGLVVYSGPYYALVSLAGIAVLAPLVLSFVPPWSSLFKQR